MVGRSVAFPLVPPPTRSVEAVVPRRGGLYIGVEVSINIRSGPTGRGASRSNVFEESATTIGRAVPRSVQVAGRSAAGTYTGSIRSPPTKEPTLMIVRVFMGSSFYDQSLP